MGEEMGEGKGEEMEEAGEEMGEEMGRRPPVFYPSSTQEMGEAGEETGEEMGEAVLLQTMNTGTRGLLKTLLCFPPASWSLMWTER